MLHNFTKDGVLMENISTRIPYGLGNTSFVDGYEVIEHIDYKHIEEASCLAV